MTLATLLLSGFFILLPLLKVGAQTQASPQSSDKPASGAPARDQASPQPTPTPENQQAPAPASTAPAQKPSTTKQSGSKPQHKKKTVNSVDCNPTPASGSPPAPSDSASSDKTPADKTPADKAAGNPSAGDTPQKATPPTPPSNCPPSKVIVKQGGTSEPSIQLAGGSGGAPERATANQMLQSAEENLKKITAQQLTSSQQDMVTQVRKFVDQSKTATAAGDLERARTLAWKAQTLSEELVSPEH
jgi:hypothetical protein